MKNQPDNLRESLWRRKLSEAERAGLRGQPELDLGSATDRRARQNSRRAGAVQFYRPRAGRHRAGRSAGRPFAWPGLELASALAACGGGRRGVDFCRREHPALRDQFPSPRAGEKCRAGGGGAAAAERGRAGKSRRHPAHEPVRRTPTANCSPRCNEPGAPDRFSAWPPRGVFARTRKIRRPPAMNIFPPGVTNSAVVPRMQSPVDFFRQLLAMTPAERVASLTNRPPEARARILAKVREYQALGPDERELRLRATELRWYLTPLLRTAAGGTRGAAGAGAGGFARTGQIAADSSGIFCRRRCSRNFWRTTRRCIISPTSSQRPTPTATPRTAKNRRAVQPVFRTDAGGKTTDAQHAVRQPSARRWKKLCSRSSNCRRSSASNACAITRSSPA